jgi:vancomycin resistance protein YoaR
MKHLTFRAASKNKFLSVLLRLIAVVVVLCSVAGCGKHTLSRATAAQAITAAIKFPISDHREISRTWLKRNSDGQLFEWRRPSENDFTERQYPVPHIDYFVKTGLLIANVARWTGLGQPSPDISEIALSFAERTKGYEVPAKQASYIGLKLCDVVFGEITGIQVNEQAGTATVEYSLRRTNWTPFGDYYKQQTPQDFPEVIAQSATFSKYDNGWRLTGVSPPD